MAAPIRRFLSWSETKVICKGIQCLVKKPQPAVVNRLLALPRPVDPADDQETVPDELEARPVGWHDVPAQCRGLAQQSGPRRAAQTKGHKPQP
eukprot:10272174-Alexandrium_andersonii.AAC.1